MTDSRDQWVPYAQPLLDAVALFEELGIGYALAGGIAAMYFGRARFTEDVDFVAIAGHMEVLSARPEVMQKHHFDPACSHKLYHQSGVQVDVWKDEFANGIVERATPVELAGRTIQLVDVYDLLAMKLRAGRLKDDYDVSEIVRSTSPDLNRLRKLLTPEQVAHLERILHRS